MNFNLFLTAFLITNVLPMWCLNTSTNITNTTASVRLQWKTFKNITNTTDTVNLRSRVTSVLGVSNANRRQGSQQMWNVQNSGNYPDMLSEQQRSRSAVKPGQEYNQKWVPLVNDNPNTQTGQQPNQPDMNALYNMQTILQGLPESDEFPAPEKGPPRGNSYNPNRGYEVYWINGHWVYSTSMKTYPNNMCGRMCFPMYKDYGVICARNKYFQYKTFDDYCELKSDDCVGYKEWTVVHTGECNPYWKTKNWALFISRPPLPSSMENITHDLDMDYLNEQ